MRPEEFDMFPRLAVDFARHKDVVQGCSVNTVREYMLDLKMFFKYVKLSRGRMSLEDESFAACDITDLDLDFFKSITTTEIYDFLFYLKNKRDANERTRARKLSAIKAFYKFLTIKKQYFEHNPSANIESPKLKKQLPKHLSVEESVSLLETAISDGTSKNRTRDYTMLTLFLNCGMRLSELAGIDLSDIDRMLRSLRVTGKGSKERIIYLNEACKKALAEYLTLRLQTPTKGGENALFLSSRGTRISIKTVQYTVNKYLNAAGLGNKGYSTHKLRHTAATLMYQSGEVDIRVLKDILGHEQLNTTQIYTHVSDAGMEAAMEKNPLAKVEITKTLPADAYNLSEEVDS